MSVNTYQDKFNQEYSRLNSEQKQAVDTIEGTVMVIAGAGTGKTQTIALRIANILQKTQTPPGGILCLTFTENAASNMRQRLLSIIGPPAYAVRINTFHSFCNDVIQDNPENFVFAPNFKPIEEIDRLLIIHDLIEKLPDGATLKPWGDHFFYQREILSRIQTLKREGVSPSKLSELIKNQELFVNNSKEIVAELKTIRVGKDLDQKLYQIVEKLNILPDLSPVIKKYIEISPLLPGPAKNPRINQKNALLKLFDRIIKDIPKQLELQLLYQGYEQELKTRGFYDFDDMILFVLEAFKNNSDLLADYQERFQYILVDEYQDTNSSQNQILLLLASYFENPNLFVVGDDDQSIFRFQGAAIENIFDFYQRFQSTIKIIVLKNNYRSHQLILDSSNSVISRNQNRITNYIKDIDKSLQSLVEFDRNPINLFVAPSTLREDYFIVSEIRRLIESGVKPQSIAVLFRNNSDINDLLVLFRHFNLSFHLETANDTLKDQSIRQLLFLLEYILNPDSDELLYKTLSSDFFHFSELDLFNLVHFSRHNQIPLNQLISDQDLLATIRPKLKTISLKKLRNFRRRLIRMERLMQIYPLDRFFNKVIRKFKFLDYVVSQKDHHSIGCLRDLYELVKTESAKGSDFHTFFNRIKLLLENNLPLSSSNVDIETGESVSLMTVHKAKGLEFDHVFIYRCLDKKWGNNRVSSILNLPLGILKTSEVAVLTNPETENEEERRLFYVALTRAKKQIYITYPKTSSTGRELLPSLFISEIASDLIELKKEESINSINALNTLFTPVSKPVKTDELAVHLKTYLRNNYKFNVSHLNSYLKCPYCFYYQTILRLPSAKDKFASLGTAVHSALSHLFKNLKNTKSLISLDSFLDNFEKYLNRENLSNKNHQEALSRGRQILSSYYEHYQDDFSCNCLIDYDFSKDNVFLDNIPITGKIDKIDIVGEREVRVVDFKTGNPDSKSSELKLESDYFRQLAFYKILAKNDPVFKYSVTGGVIDFVEKSRVRKNFIRKEYLLTEEDEKKVEVLIKEVYEKILNLEFPISPDCDDRHMLHRLAK